MGTLIENLRKGSVPPELDRIAEEERIAVDKLAGGVVAGQIVAPRNTLHQGVKPVGIGTGLRTKVNANIGTSVPCSDMDEELAKLDVAVKAGADAVMDLSTGGDLDLIRRKIVESSPVPLGTVPIYRAAAKAKEERGSVVEMTDDDLFKAIEVQANDGVDFMTIHSGVTWQAIEILRQVGRVADIVSRGGALIIGWMIHNQKENPLYEQFDRLLEIARRFDVTLSLGDGLRPGCLADASDGAQFQELITLGKLAKRAREADVQVMIEGPGHMPLDQIKANVLLEKEICDGAPFYLLGPLVTDVAPGYDHITAAIGGAVAASAGADFICYVTPSEHLGLPTAADVKDGVIAARIAAHAADVVKGVAGAAEWDLAMAKARKALDWREQAALAIDPEKAARAHQERLQPGTDVCTMCGDYCAMKLVSEFLGAEEVEKC